MLKKLEHPWEGVSEEGAVVRMADAEYPAPFASGLEFNAPVHGTWNIVHTGMLIPGAHQIYVCADNCMRGVVLTAAEMNASDRFSFVILKEKDLDESNLEKITIEGVADVLNKLPVRPQLILLYTVCMHHFLNCDLDYVYRELRKRFPECLFVRCFMDPMMRKSGPTPDQKMRRSLYEALPELEPETDVLGILGSDFALGEYSDLTGIASRTGTQLRQLPTCRTFEDYRRLGGCAGYLCIYPNGLYGAQMLCERLHRELLYLPACFGYVEIRTGLERLWRQLAGAAFSETEAQSYFDTMQTRCEEALRSLKNLIGGTPVVLDYTVHPRPLGLARLLLEHGFSVEKIWLDAVNGEEEQDFRWLKEHAPDLRLAATVQVKQRVLKRHSETKTLAVGQKAAWFSDTAYFVNLVEGGGLYGYHGILRLTELMREAFLYEKDTAALVVRKGLGCDCCLQQM